MNKLHINISLIIFLVINGITFSQERSTIPNISDCSGGIELQPNKNMQVKFTKSPGAINDLKEYSSQLQEIENNSLWFKFTAQKEGILKLAFKKNRFPLEYSLYLLSKDEDCTALMSGAAKLIKHQTIDKKKSLIEIDSIKYRPQQKVYICLNTSSRTKKDITIKNSFTTVKAKEDQEKIDPISYDFRNASTDQPYHIMIRDIRTNQPIIAKVIITGSKHNDALYKASDFIFSSSDHLKMELKINARGYFFKDVKISNRGKTSTKKEIFMQPLKKNQLIELESMKFESQTDVFLSEAIPKLKRLRDFMVTNPDVEIEIQGHVNLMGKNTLGAKILSKKRAKSVRKFLANNGIDKNRIEVEGFGNSKMIYPKAETKEERQANRRVEIRIK